MLKLVWTNLCYSRTKSMKLRTTGDFNFHYTGASLPGPNNPKSHVFFGQNAGNKPSEKVNKLTNLFGQRHERNNVCLKQRLYTTISVHVLLYILGYPFLHACLFFLGGGGIGARRPMQSPNFKNTFADRLVNLIPSPLLCLESFVVERMFTKNAYLWVCLPWSLTQKLNHQPLPQHKILSEQ